MHAARLAPLLAFLVACSRDSRVEVTLESTPGALVRTLEAEGGFLPDTFRRILIAFDARDEASASGRFAGNLPGEFGGSGFHRRFESDLGVLVAYSELLASPDDPWEHVERIDREVERAANLLLPWLAHELADVPEAVAALREHEAELIRGFKGLLLELALAPPEDVPALALHLLAESGLLDPDELPELFSTTDEEQAEALLFRTLRTSAARMLELEADAPSLHFLASEEACTAHWRAWLARGEARPVDDLPGPDSEPGDVLASPLELIDVPLFKDTERVSVRLTVPVEPLWTNGRHDAAAQRLEWPAVDLVDAFAPLALRYAVWVEPDEARQGALLGERRLAGQALADYVMWFAALPAESRARWTAALDRLVATPELEAPEAALAELQEGFERGRELLAAATAP